MDDYVRGSHVSKRGTQRRIGASFLLNGTLLHQYNSQETHRTTCQGSRKQEFGEDLRICDLASSIHWTGNYLMVPSNDDILEVIAAFVDPE